MRAGRKHEFGFSQGLAALLEDDSKSKADGAGEDLLAEERELRRRGKWWWPWWLTFAMNGDWFTGRKGLWASVVAMVFLGGLFLWAVVSGAGTSREGYAWDGDGAGGSFDYTVDRMAGGELRPHEVALAAAYGEPGVIGPGGMPLITHRGSGLERELTALEVDFYDRFGESGVSGVEKGRDSVWWNPGPNGWGMWWRETPAEEVVAARLGFTREGWRARQEAELQWLADRLEEALVVVGRLEDPLVRERGLGGELTGVLAQVERRHPEIGERRGVAVWAGVPLQWECWEDLELRVNWGVSQGCPGGELVSAVSEVWGSAGAVYSKLGELGAEMSFLDGLDSEAYYGSWRVAGVFYGMVDLLEVELLNLGLAVAEMRRLSGMQELFIAVDFFGTGAN